MNDIEQFQYWVICHRFEISFAMISGKVVRNTEHVNKRRW